MEKDLNKSFSLLDRSLSYSYNFNERLNNTSYYIDNCRLSNRSYVVDELGINRDCVNVEQAFQITKGNQRSQWIYGLTLSFIYSLTGNFVYALPFLGKYPDYECRSNLNPEWYQCQRNDVCDNFSEINGFEYRVNWNSIYSIDNWVTSMNLECAPEYQIGLFGSLYFIGYLLGSALLTRYADVKGRKWILLYSLLTSTIAACLFLLTNNLMVTYILILINGFVIAPTASISYLYMMEVVEEKNKMMFNCITCTIDALDIIFIAVYYYYFKSGESILYIYVFHSIINLATLFYTPESPHFLYSKCRFSELKECFNNYARLNNAQKLSPTIKFSKEVNEKENVVEDSSIKVLISDRTRLINLIIMVLNWCVCSFCFYFIGYFVKYFNGDMYTNTFMMGTADVFAVLLTRIGQHYFSTKKGFFIAFITVFITSLLYLTIESFSIFAPLLILITRLGTTFAFTLVYYGNSETFPTVFLSTVFAISHICAKTSTVFAPMMAEIMEQPIIIIACLTLFSSLISTFLRPSKQAISSVTKLSIKDNQSKKGEAVELSDIIA